ncbi:hypothetical protein [Paracoccus sp. (in: a-proteobacteria)]|uniref:hypothetical protein n=1 Tax=Paracoccus sp. TaxID=267 RepID=UPI0032206AAA
MTRPPLRLAGALTILALAACSQNARAPEAPGTVAVIDSMTDPATGAVVIPGPSLKGTAPRTPGKSLTSSSIGIAASPAATVPEPAPTPVSTGTGRRLGSTIASLGDPSLPGLWIRTPLVQADSAGKIVNPANGKFARVRLMPLGGPAGGGSQVSMAALQALGVSLTDLPALEVYQD